MSIHSNTTLKKILLSKVVLCDTNYAIPLSFLWLAVHKFIYLIIKKRDHVIFVIKLCWFHALHSQLLPQDHGSTGIPTTDLVTILLVDPTFCFLHISFPFSTSFAKKRGKKSGKARRWCRVVDSSLILCIYVFRLWSIHLSYFYFLKKKHKTF